MYQKIDILNDLLTLIHKLEYDRAKQLIAQKQKEMESVKANGIRIEIGEYLKMIKEIDKQLIIHKIKEAKIQEFTPDGINILDSYIKYLTEQRKIYVLKKDQLAKNNH